MLSTASRWMGAGGHELRHSIVSKWSRLLTREVLDMPDEDIRCLAIFQLARVHRRRRSISCHRSPQPGSTCSCRGYLARKAVQVQVDRTRVTAFLARFFPLDPPSGTDRFLDPAIGDRLRGWRKKDCQGSCISRTTKFLFTTC